MKKYLAIFLSGAFLLLLVMTSCSEMFPEAVEPEMSLQIVYTERQIQVALAVFYINDLENDLDIIKTNGLVDNDTLQDFKDLITTLKIELGMASKLTDDEYAEWFIEFEAKYVETKVMFYEASKIT